MEHIQRLAIIGLINLLVYYKTLFYGYVGDDVERSERKEPVFKNAWHRRWIQFIGLRHTNSMVAHFLTLITHTACCMMIYISFGRFFGSMKGSLTSYGSYEIPFLAAILFSLNPANIQGSTWISGRNYVTTSILAMAMFAFPVLSLLFYASVSHFAVNAWFTPLAFLGTSQWKMLWIIPFVWIFTQNNRSTLHRKLWETAGLKTTNEEMRAIKPRKIIPFLKTYLYYFAMCIFPHKIGLEHDYLRGFGTNKIDNEKGYRLDKFFYMGLFLFVFVLGICWDGLIHGWTFFSFGLFWFTINIAMWCNFVTYQQHISERYVYLANIGMMISLASLIIKYPILITAFLVGYLVRLIYVMDMYLNDYWAVEHTITDSKKLSYMWLMRGVKKFMVRDYVGSIHDFNEAYIYRNYDLKVLYNLATNYFILGDSVKAREFLEKAKANIYDGLEQDVKPSFDRLEGLIKTVEEAKARGETQVQIDMKQLMIVK